MGYKVDDIYRPDRDGSHKISYFVHAPISDPHSYDERFYWCIENLKGGFQHNVAGAHFYEESDAIMFRLRWTQCIE